MPSRSRPVDPDVTLILRALIFAFLCIVAGAGVGDPQAAALPLTAQSDPPEEPPAGQALDAPDDSPGPPPEEDSGASSKEPSGDPAGSADDESEAPVDEPGVEEEGGGW